MAYNITIKDKNDETCYPDTLEHFVRDSEGKTIPQKYLKKLDGVRYKPKYDLPEPVTPNDPFLNYYTKTETHNLISNPNLLINGDFKVNQRGQNSYTEANKYTVDRWKNGGYTGLVVATITNGLNVTTSVTGTGVLITQKLEEKDYLPLQGKTVTMSFKVNANSGTNIYLRCLVNGSSVGDTTGTSETGIFSKTITLPNTITSLEIQLRKSTGLLDANIEWIKLELGSIATSYTPRPYDEELAICQMPYDNKGISTTYSNPNLLINGDFKINQRGQESYTGNNVYSVDRWKINGSGLSVTKLDKGINLKNIGTWSYLNYMFEDKDWKTLLGKTITISMYVSRLVSNYNTYFQISTVTGETATAIRISETGLHSFTYTVPLNAEKLDLRICYTTTGTSIDVDMDVDFVKVEINSVATPYSPRPYAEELSLCQMYQDNNVATPYSNPNLLINGDFRVNQRGIYSNNTTNLYMADRWYKVVGGSGNVEIEENNCKITVQTEGTGDQVFFRQRIECPKTLIGKRITASLNCKNVQGSVFGLGIWGRTATSQLTGSQVIVKEGINSVTFTVPNNTEILSFEIYVKRSLAVIGDFIEFADCKLEIGSVATPFSPRPYGEELALCQRYYWSLTPQYSYGDICSMSYISAGTKFIGILNLPQEMRISPTFKVLGSPTLTFRSTSLSVSALTKEQYQGNQVVLSATVSDTNGLSQGLNYYLRSSGNKPTLELDAEIY